MIKINLFPSEKGGWQMNTMREDSSGWHIVYGSTIEACFKQEFESDLFENEEDAFA